jgi:surface protein
MVNMFNDCSSLTELDLSNFDTSKVTYMGCMLSDCKKLESLTLGEKFKSITKDALLLNGDGWVNANDPKTVISGSELFAVIENEGKNTYIRFGTETKNKPTYPTNIKVEYSEKYHQVRFTWDKVEGADRYGIAVYLAGKWRVQTQNITGTVYTSPKNLTPGKTYRVAIAARVNGKWDTANAIKNAVTVTIK